MQPLPCAATLLLSSGGRRRRDGCRCLPRRPGTGQNRDGAVATVPRPRTEMTSFFKSLLGRKEPAQEDIEISRPERFRQTAHVGYDSKTGEFSWEGLPEEWKTMLRSQGFTKEETVQNHETVVRVVCDTVFFSLLQSVISLRKGLLPFAWHFHASDLLCSSSSSRRSRRGAVRHRSRLRGRQSRNRLRGWPPHRRRRAASLLAELEASRRCLLRISMAPLRPPRLRSRVGPAADSARP
jgi:hypothetical protein